jgi:hypothetical protein
MDVLTAIKRLPRALGAGFSAFFAGVQRAALGRTTLTQPGGQQSPHGKIDTTKTIEERNRNVIESHVKKLTAGYHDRYYIENSVRDCIQEIALAERNVSMAPNYAYLAAWSKKATPEYQTLKVALLTIGAESTKGRARFA